MKKVISLVLAMSLAGIVTPAFATDSVDLSDKKGIIDPKDLKRHDPRPPKIEKKAPPPPEKKQTPDVPPFEVKKSHESYPGNNPTNK